MDATIGDNKGPLDPEMLRDRLTSENAELIARKDELLASASRVPAITSPEIAGKVTDFIKQLTAFVKNADGTRVKEKEPFLAGGRTVDGYFKALTDPIDAAKKTVERTLTAYQQEQAAIERRRREEEARKAEEERKAREAEERAAAEERRRQEAEAARVLAAAKNEADLAAAIIADEARKKAQAEEDARRVASEAARAEEEKRKREAEAKNAALTQNRGDFGAMASLRTTWEFADLDRAKIDLEALRQHIPTDGLEKAVRAYIKAGGRELRGVRIFEQTTSVVR